MSLKEIRVKVAHALRDKRQSHDHEAALARLKVRTEVDDKNSDVITDSHYIAANAMILNVKLTGRESETLMKALLCDAIDSVGVSTDAGYHHEDDDKPCVISSNDETVIEICDLSEENITSYHTNISSKPLPQRCIIFDNQRNQPIEKIPVIWPISVSLQVDPIILCDGDNIPGEYSQQWVPNRFLSSNTQR
jgi:hypothetical protein